MDKLGGVIMITNDMITRRAMMDDMLQDKDGTQITCEKCKGSKFSEMKIYGRSKQVTTTGAQLLDLDAIGLKTGGGATIRRLDDGGFLVDGTPGQAYEQYITRVAINFSQGTYFVSGGRYADGCAVVQINILNADGTRTYKNNASFDVLGTEQEIVLIIQSVSEKPINNYKIYPMINSGSTPLPWEQYTGGQPSPSPDYPQEIESVGTKWSTGANLLDISQWSAYEKTYGLTMTIDEDGYFQLDGTYDNGAGAGNIGNCMFRFMRTKVGTVFPDGVKFAGGMMKVSENVSKLYFLCTGLSENTPCLVISFSAVNGENIKIRFRPMLYVGDTAPEWEPYTGGVPKPYGDKIGVEVRGKNLLDPAYVYENNASNYKMYKDGFLLKKGVTYTLSCYPVTPEGLYINEWNIANNTAILAVTYGKNVLTYTPEQDKKVFFDYYCLNRLDPVTSKLMLEIGKSPNPSYEPYHDPQSTSISTPNGLPGIPTSSGGNYTDADGRQWICDEVDFARGVYVQRVAYTIVDGGEIKFKARGGEFWNLPNGSAPGCGDQNTAINNFFSKNMFGANGRFDFIYALSANMEKYFKIKTPDELNEFCKNKYDAGTPLTLYYALAAPIETPLTDDQLAAYKQLHTYADSTAIISNDANAYMGVAYRRLRD